MVLPRRYSSARKRPYRAVSWCVLIILPLCSVFAGAKPQRLQVPLPEAESYAEAAVTEPAPSVPAAEGRGETVMRALAKAYPDRIEKVEFLDGDWTIKLYDEIFYFAGGRLLPASLLDEADEYAPQPFYNYHAELPPWVDPTPEESARMEEQTKQRGQRRPKRSSHFYDTLWRARNRQEAWDRVKQIRFFGHEILVHYTILEELSLIEARLLEASKTSAEVRRWIDNLDTVESWNWRDIAASQNRSYHAYGAAVDLLPKSLGGLATYWLWTAQNNGKWWTVPYTKRFHPPEEVIKAFESFGFIWGGKWRFYDTMHFEYRPEILGLSGMEQTDPRDLR